MRLHHLATKLQPHHRGQPIVWFVIPFGRFFEVSAARMPSPHRLDILKKESHTQSTQSYCFMWRYVFILFLRLCLPFHYALPIFGESQAAPLLMKRFFNDAARDQSLQTLLFVAENTSLSTNWLPIYGSGLLLESVKLSHPAFHSETLNQERLGRDMRGPFLKLRVLSFEELDEATLITCKAVPEILLAYWTHSRTDAVSAITITLQEEVKVHRYASQLYRTFQESDADLRELLLWAFNQDATSPFANRVLDFYCLADLAGGAWKAKAATLLKAWINSDSRANYITALNSLLFGMLEEMKDYDHLDKIHRRDIGIAAYRVAKAPQFLLWEFRSKVQRHHAISMFEIAMRYQLVPDSTAPPAAKRP